MSEDSKDKSHKEMGAEVVYRKFIERYNNELKALKVASPNRYLAIVAEWTPVLLEYFDESFNASLSAHILEEALRGADGNIMKSRAFIEGLYNSSLRVDTKRPSKETSEYFEFFFESRNQTIVEDEEEAMFYLGNEAPSVISNYDGSYQSELAMGIVRKGLKETPDKMLEPLVNGLLIRVLVTEDYPEFERWLNGENLE
jgi:hypothetical protein